MISLNKFYMYIYFIQIYISFLDLKECLKIIRHLFKCRQEKYKVYKYFSQFSINFKLYLNSN